jgi:hypothetical protein
MGFTFSRSMISPKPFTHTTLVSTIVWLVMAQEYTAYHQDHLAKILRKRLVGSYQIGTLMSGR